MKSKVDLFLEKPLMNAAGMLGFSPDAKSSVGLAGFGAFVTNPISWQSRTPTKGNRYIPFTGGFLIHTGHPNPGLRKVIRQHSRRWAQSSIPIIVHLLAQDPETVFKMVEILEGLDGVIGVEIGLPPDVDSGLASEMVAAALGELAVIVKLPFEGYESLAADLGENSISAVSLAAPRGVLLDNREFVSGRLYGPSQFPLTLSAIVKLANGDTPVIGAGGVFTRNDMDAILASGAIAVQLDAVLWRGGL